ncbi:class III lanthipeptide [Staphylococcus pseudintermedius]|nr:class III lanthipeptide [Staphylococcus pseudintermedius]
MKKILELQKLSDGRQYSPFQLCSTTTTTKPSRTTRILTWSSLSNNCKE